MESQVTEDTDEECCDDPIKLFDSDEHAVYFGSQIYGNGYRNKEPGWHVEITESNVICESEEDPSRKPSDKTSWSGNISECDLPQVCVKLVDCGQFPWYFRKYAKQILTKTNVIQESDSDREIDVGKEDSYLEDCFIVEEFKDTSEKINEQHKMNLPITILKNKLDEKRLEEMRRKREDTEIQRALSQKNIAKIDLKRNQGLVGMKISQKIVKDETLITTASYINEIKATDTKQVFVKADEMYLNAADKMLSHIGTELIPIIETNKSDSFSKSNKIAEKEDKTIKNSVPLKVPVNFRFKKIRKKIFDTTKPKTIIESLPEVKIKNKDSNKSVAKCPEYKSDMTNGIMLGGKTNITAKNTNTSDKSLSHVKDVKKTNKYKNDQEKNLDKTDQSLIGVLVTQPYEINTKVAKCDKQIKHDINNGKQTKFNEIVKKTKQNTGKNKREISSPILPCTILPKKLKINHKISSKYKLDTILNTSKEVENLNNIVNNIKNGTIQESHESKCITPKSSADSKPSNISTKPFSHGLDVLSGENIRRQSLKVPNKHTNEDTNLKTNKPNKNHSPNQDNKILEDKTLKTDSHQNQVNKYLTNNNSVVNSIIYRTIENDKLHANGNDSKAGLKPVGEAKSKTTSKQPQTRQTDVNNAFSSQISYKNSIPGKIIPNDGKNINENASVCNRYASAIIIKPSQFIMNDQSGCSSQGKGLPNLPIPVYMRPRTEDYQNFHPQYYKSGHSDMYPNNLPSSVTHSLSKKFSTQSQQLKNVTQYWQYFSQNVSGHPISSVPPPPPSPPPTNNLNQTFTKNNKNSHLNTTIHPSATTSQHNRDNSIIGRNNGGLVKKINIVAKPFTKQNKCNEITVEKFKESQINKECKNSEVVATKTQMLEELDKLSFADNDVNVSKGVYYKDRTNDTKNINKFEVNQKKPEALSLRVEDKNQKEQPNGYSPPILPIPTYQKVLDRVISKSQYDNLKWKNSQIYREEFKSSLKEEIKPINRKYFEKSCKRKLYSGFRKPDSRGRNDDAKKISLEEYKKRSLKTDKKSLSHKYERVNRPNKDYKYRKNTDYSTESDLGYDSDSTMVL